MSDLVDRVDNGIQIFLGWLDSFFKWAFDDDPMIPFFHSWMRKSVATVLVINCLFIGLFLLLAIADILCSVLALSVAVGIPAIFIGLVWAGIMKLMGRDLSSN